MAGGCHSQALQASDHPRGRKKESKLASQGREKKERKKTDNPREGLEDGTPQGSALEEFFSGAVTLVIAAKAGQSLTGGSVAGNSFASAAFVLALRERVLTGVLAASYLILSRNAKAQAVRDVQVLLRAGEAASSAY